MKLNTLVQTGTTVFDGNKSPIIISGKGVDIQFSDATKMSQKKNNYSKKEARMEEFVAMYCPNARYARN